MGVYEQFPYVNFHGVNLSWILEKTRYAVDTADGVRKDLGSLADLDTATKESVVAAINELVEAGGYGPQTSYNSLTEKPQIGGVTLSGDKTLAQLGITFHNLPDRPFPAGFILSVAGNTSKTYNFGDNDRVSMLVVGSYQAAHAWVASIFQAYRLGGSYHYNEIALSDDNSHITMTGGDDTYSVTFANDTDNTFVGRVIVFQGDVSEDRAVVRSLLRGGEIIEDPAPILRER